MLPHSPAGAGRDQGGIPGHGPRGALQVFPSGIHRSSGIRAELDAGQGRGSVGRSTETEEREENEEDQRKKGKWKGKCCRGGRNLWWCWSCWCRFWREIRHFQLSHPAQQSGIRCPSSLSSPFPALLTPGTPNFHRPWRGKSPHPTWEPQGRGRTNPLLLPGGICIPPWTGHPLPGPPLPARLPLKRSHAFPGIQGIDFLQEKIPFSLPRAGPACSSRLPSGSG